MGQLGRMASPVGSSSRNWKPLGGRPVGSQADRVLIAKAVVFLARRFPAFLLHCPWTQKSTCPRRMATAISVGLHYVNSAICQWNTACPFDSRPVNLIGRAGPSRRSR